MPSIAYGLTSDGGIDRVSTRSQRHAHREVEQCQFQLGPLAGEVVEPRAGHLGAALDVDRAEELTQLEVVSRTKPSAAKSAECRASPTRRSRPRRPPAPRRRPGRRHWLEQLVEGRAASSAASAFLTSPASSLVRASSASAPRRWPWGPACRVLLLGPQLLVRAMASAAPRRPPGSSTSASDSPRARWSRTRSGSVRSTLTSITGAAYRGPSIRSASDKLPSKWHPAG